MSATTARAPRPSKTALAASRACQAPELDDLAPEPPPIAAYFQDIANDPAPQADASSIPQAMQHARRWLVWRAIPKDGRIVKQPFYVGGKPRQGKLDAPEDLAALATFDHALKALKNGTYTGLGFALGPDETNNVWQGIDLDHIDERPELAALGESLPGYVERSPSGTGLHAIGYGQSFKSLGSNTTGIEAYAKGRYFTVTGDAIGGDIEDVSAFVEGTLSPLHHPEAKAKATPQPAASADSFFAKVNAKAMASFASWVPALFPSATPYHDGYRIESAALGRPLEEAISIVPEGIRDFGEENGKTPLDLVLEWGPAKDATEAAHWLCQRMQVDPAALGWKGKNASANPSDPSDTRDQSFRDASDPDTLAAAIETARRSIERAQDDPGAPYEALEQWRLILKNSMADYVRLRADLKKCKELSITAFEREVRGTEAGDDPASKADELAELAKAKCTLFHDADLEPYASFAREGHMETWKLYSKGFGEWLSYLSYTETGTAPTDSTLKVVLATLAGAAKFDGEECAVYLRVACLEPGKRYVIDLCDDQWRVVEVTPQGWFVNPHPTTLFVRSNSMRPLACPIQNGDLKELWPLVNIPEEDRLIVLAWMLETFRPETPYAVLALMGEQGSVKSSTQNGIREIIDPNRVNLRAAPKTVEDLYVSASNGHLVSLENISHLSPPFQDALCVLATGGGFAGRTLFTNGDETVMELRRPIILNGIAAAVTAQDLGDRTVQINCPEITKRRTSGAVTTALEEARPSIFGGLLDLFVAVLATLPSVKIDAEALPRMADFAYLGEAVYRVHGKQPGEFLSGYTARRKDSVHRTLDSIPVAAAIITYLDKYPNGLPDLTVKGAWETLSQHKTGEEAWPRSAKGFADSLRRVAPSLRLIGIKAKISDKPTMHGYTVDICFWLCLR